MVASRSSAARVGITRKGAMVGSARRSAAVGRKARVWLGVAGLALFCAGCVSVGREFPVAPVDSIVIGKTTMADARELFGEPWRQGVEDGERTWTFARYRYNILGASQTRDLKLRFDANDRVVSFSFNSTFPEDARR